MILIDGVEYKDNLKLKCFSGVPNTTPNVGVSEGKITNPFVFNDQLYYIDSSYNICLWNGQSVEIIGNIGTAYSNYFFISYNGYLYAIKKTTDTSTIKCLKITLSPFSKTEIGYLNYPIYSGSNREKYIDHVVINDTIYVLTQYSSNPMRLSTLNIDTLEFNTVMDFTFEYTTNNRGFGRLINLDNELYLISYPKNKNVDGGLNLLYKFSNNNIIKKCVLPLTNEMLSYSDTGTYCPKAFVMNNKLYVYGYIYGSSSSSDFHGCNYIWEYDKDNNIFKKTIELPIPWSNNKYGESTEIYSMNNNTYRVNAFSYPLLVYNNTLHLITSNAHYIYNSDEDRWLRYGYWICKIDDSNTITTTT